MVYVVWFLFCWVGAARFRPSRPFALFSSRLCLLPPFQSSREDCSDAALTHAVWSARFIFVYGMQIYNLLGNEAQTAFSQQWVISWAMDNAQQWRDIVTTALKVALVMYILDRMRITSDVTWFEHHIDVLSVQAALASRQFSWLDRTAQYLKFTSRVG